jgi:Fe-S cluster assembly protein SufD
VNAIANAPERDRIVAGFRDFAASLPSGEPAWLPELRTSAIKRFEALGFPTRKREDWKYTGVGPIALAVASTVATTGATRASDAASDESIRSAVARATSDPALVFVDGEIAPAFTAARTLPSGAIVEPLARLLRDRPALVESLLRDSADDDRRAFVALNSAFQRDGAFVSISPGVAVESPIHVVHVATGIPRTHHLRNLIEIGESASAIVVEHYVSAGDDAYVTNTVTTVSVAENASLEHVILECEGTTARHLGTRDVEIARNARYRSHFVSLGGVLVRNEIEARLVGPGAECDLNGLFIADGARHVDNQTTIDHVAPQGTSRELYKGVLDGRSHGIFNGKVIVRPDAQKTNAWQSNPNLLLADGAEIDTRPNLEIHADDVKCSHGSTIGRLDEDALFFLRARGIDAEFAREMLCRAFAAEIIDAIPIAEVCDRIGKRVAAVFGGEPERSA